MFAIERVRLVVDGRNCSLFFGPADDDLLPAAASQIERVQRLAAFHQDVVRDVDNVVDRRLPNRRQPLGSQAGLAADLDAADDAGGVARAKVGAVDA